MGAGTGVSLSSLLVQNIVFIKIDIELVKLLKTVGCTMQLRTPESHTGPKYYVQYKEVSLNHSSHVS